MFARTKMSGDDYEIIRKVALEVKRLGVACQGWVGVNLAWTLARLLPVRGGFLHPPPPTIFRGMHQVLVLPGCTWEPLMYGAAKG